MWPCVGVPPAAVSGNESEQPAFPETTTPEEPSASLHSLAPAGPHHSAMLVSSAGDSHARLFITLLVDIDVFQASMCKSGLAHCFVPQRPGLSVMTISPSLVAVQLGDAVQYMPAKVAYDVPMMLIVS